MAPRRTARDAEVVRINVVILGAVADKANGAMYILDDFGNREPRLRTVDDGEDGVAAPEEGSVHFRTNGFRTRTPAAADDEDDTPLLED